MSAYYVKMEDKAYKNNLKILSLSLVLILGYYLFLYNPILLKIKSCQVQQKYLKEKLIRMQEASKKINTTPVRPEIVTQEETDQILKSILVEAKNRDINIVSVSVKDPQRYNNLYTIIPVLIEMESTYEKMGIFLGALKNKQGILVVVKNIELKLHRENGPILKANALLNIYILNKDA